MAPLGWKGLTMLHAHRRAGASDIENTNEKMKLHGTDQILAEIIQGGD
jgi:hypothetical protein